MAVTCYLDESGTTPSEPNAVVAGLVMPRNNLLLFDVVWEGILAQYKIKVPLHMKEFGKHGKLGHLDYRARFALFTKLVGAINCYKTHSVAATLSYEEFNNIVPDKAKRYIGVYGICFMLASNLCFCQAKLSNYDGEIAFFLEQGARHSGHILNAHNAMLQIQKDKELPINVGPIAFGPKKISVLQAADIIAWAVRRRVSELPIGKGFQPISNLFEIRHIERSYDDKSLQDFVDAIGGH
ncbi:MAG: DUF3800 domain-containing protein [Desulfobaccales bacterium]